MAVPASGAESSPEYWQRVEEIFHLALDVPAEQRAALVREHCAGDAALEKEVRGILDGYAAQDRLTLSRSDALFGAFEAIRKIGEGGMGAVYLGRRCRDFEQQAAIKVIHGNPAEIALMADRFRRERQILAGLDHPNIARLLDGGVTSAGQPYLVMEYVEGVRLDEYCQANRLATDQRLRLFQKICAAVHFAHQHLIIHRDLKPGNILVNAEGEPKLLDFGIAKVLAQDEFGDRTSTDRTSTMTGAMMMTPQYASPEQIRGQPCTVASDVYSLGVILYQLLTGRTPYSGEASTAAEFIAAVVTREIPRPSAVAPTDLRSSLRGDLDGIVIKALAKKPEQRYGSVAQFSEDIRRHMQGLPVSAVEGTRIYVARKFVSRHRVAVGASALVLLSLIGGLAATLWQARVAERERALADQRFSDARKLANYLLFPLYDSVQALPGSLPVRAEMAGQSLLYLDRLEAARSSDRALRLELAEGYLRLGTILEAPVGSGDSLGETAKALDVDRKAVSILETLNKDAPRDAAVQRDLARAYQLLGSVWNLRGKPDDGIAELAKSTAMFDRVIASNPRDVEALIQGGRAYLAYGDAVSGRGGGFIETATRDQVLPAAGKAIAYFRAALSISPQEDRALLGLAQAGNLKGNLVTTQDPRAGESVYQSGLDALKQLSPAARNQPDSEALEARLLTMVAFVETETGRPADAIRTMAPAQEILDRLARADPKNATNALRRVNLYRTRGVANEYLDRAKDAIADYAKTVEILNGMIEVDPAKASYQVVRAEVQGKLGALLAKDGRAADAEKVLKAAMAYLGNLADRPDAAPQNLNQAANAFISSPIDRLIDPRRALGYAQRADQLAKGRDYIAIFNIAQCYEMLHDGPKALQAIERDLALLPAPAPGEKPTRNRQLVEKHLHIIQTLVKTGRLPDEN